MKQKSGVFRTGWPWTPELPESWAIAKIVHHSSLRTGGTPDRENPDFWREGSVPWLASGEVNQGRITRPTTHITESALRHSNARVLPVRSVLLALAGQGRTKGMAALLAIPAACNQSIAAFVCDERTLHPEFLWYYLLANYANLRGLVGDDLRDGLSLGILATAKVPLPPIHVQRRIADFLDRKTAAIDKLIAKKERLVALLAEKRQALITQAVTKGLDPTVPMKNSGREWIGLIPAHWSARRLKFVCRLESGHTPSKSEVSYWLADECVIPWVSLNDTKALEASDYIEDTAVKISATGMANSSAHIIPGGAVVFNRDGARVGLAAITTRPMALSQHIIAWVCGPEMRNTFLLHVIYAMQAELVRVTAGATIPTIGMSDVRELTSPVPPLEEQDRIVSHVIDQRTLLSSTMAKVEKQIDRLREYRQAVITAAVTGKLDAAQVEPRTERVLEAVAEGV